MPYLNHGKEYKNTSDFLRRAQPLVMEIRAFNMTRFVTGMTEAGCRRRAESIYGKGYKEITITTQREALCLK